MHVRTFGIVGALSALLLWSEPGQATVSSVADSVAAGSVVGTVLLSVPPEAPPPMLSPYARRRYAPPSSNASAAASLRNVVVYLEGVPPQKGAARAVIRQSDRTILPHVTVIPRGARIDFPNDDEVFHNLFSLSGAKKFNLGRYAPGETRSVTFERSGVVQMFCDIHSEMSGTILVVDSNFYSAVDAGGNFRLDGVPPGSYTLVAWHPTTGPVRRPINVTSGTSQVQISLTGRA